MAIGIRMVVWTIGTVSRLLRRPEDHLTMQSPAPPPKAARQVPENTTDRHNSVDIRTKSVKLAPTAAFRAMGDEGVILMTDSGQIYSTNPSGTAFIRQITVGRTVAEAVSAVLDEYDVQEDVLLADLEELVAFLEAEGVVVTVGS